MSTATLNAVTAVNRPLSALLGYTLGELLLGGQTRGALYVSGRDDSGFDETAFAIEAKDFQPPLVPPALVAALSKGELALHCSLAPRDGTASTANAIRLNALSATWTFEPTYIGREPVVPAAPLAAAQQAVAGFSLAPAACILGGVPEGGRFSFTAIWRLDEPLHLRTRAQQAAALDLIRALATRLGAEVPPAEAAVEHLVVPVVGSRVRGLDAFAVCLHADAEAAVTVNEIEAAIGGSKRGAKR